MTHHKVTKQIRKHSQDTIFSASKKDSGPYQLISHKLSVTIRTFLTAIQTILECFQKGREAAGDNAIICGTPTPDLTDYTTRTYGEFAATSQYLANSLKKHGLVSGESKIAIYSSNCYEYDAVIIGGYYQNICNVSLYDTFGEQAVKYILEHVS